MTIVLQFERTPGVAAPTPHRLRIARLVCACMPPVGAQWARRRIYPQELAFRDDLRFTTSLVTGSLFSGSTRDHVAYPVAVHGYFNWRNLAIARAACEPGDTIVEIGANTGTETVGFSDIVGVAGAVHAFEPYPPNIEQLTLNARQARHANIQVHPVALGDRAGEVRFAAPPDSNSGRGRVVASTTRGMDAREDIVVPCATLDGALAAQKTAPQMLIIDAEGHEPAILRGAEHTIASARPVIVLELHRTLLSANGESPESVITSLEDHEYQLFDISRYGLVPRTRFVGSVPDEDDWIAVLSGSKLVARVASMLRRCAAMPCIGGVNPLRR